LLIQASDTGPGATTLGPPTQNPSGLAGATVTFTDAPRAHTIDDLVLVWVDPMVAAQKAQDQAANYSKYVTGVPQPFEVGTNGLIGVGLSPDNSKSVTYVTFAEGKAIADLEFDGPPNDAAERDHVLAVARAQDAAIKKGLFS
jgi:hypothetical protein